MLRRHGPLRPRGGKAGGNWGPLLVPVPDGPSTPLVEDGGEGGAKVPDCPLGVTTDEPTDGDEDLFVAPRPKPGGGNQIRVLVARRNEHGEGVIGNQVSEVSRLPIVVM